MEIIAPASILGAAVWCGRVPTHATAMLISPTLHEGPFRFVVERLVLRSWLSLLAHGFAHRPRQTRSAILTRAIGWRPESDNNLAWATRAIDLRNFPSWASRRRRAFDPADFDRTRSNVDAVRFTILVRDEHGPAALARTRASLDQQPYRRWTLVPFHDGAKPAAGHEALEESDGHHLVCVVEAGDRFDDFALSFIAEQSRRYEATIFVGDCCFNDEPVFHTAFSPAQTPCVTFVPASLWALREKGAISPLSADDNQPVAMVRLGRILLHGERAPATASAAPVPRRQDSAGEGGRATIIIPTRNQTALLSRCLDSLRARTPATSFEIVLIDNGSDAASREHLDVVGGQADVTVIRRPDPFNFSAFCNDAAGQTRTDLLVFLNDDTEALTEGWLARLAHLARKSDVGAVGARLVYPDGRLQHDGVVIGMGGSAGHYGAGEKLGSKAEASPTTPRPVSAVTGACLVVERAKFLAVGGFDAEHMPIELSDIDLCLKLNASGWQTFIDTGVQFTHHESVSRGGATFRRLSRYRSQRDVFTDRWRHVLRDDPAFHPALSLFSVTPALD